MGCVPTKADIHHANDHTTISSTPSSPPLHAANPLTSTTSPPQPPATPPPPDLSIPRSFIAHSTVQAALDASGGVADRVHSFIDTYTSTLTTLQSDDTFTSFLQHAGEAAGIIGDIGSRTPLVGVVFAALSAVGKRISDTEATRTGFNDLHRTAIDTARLVQMAESDGPSTYPAVVQQALDSFWEGMYELTRLLYAVRGKGYVHRLLCDSGHQQQLQSIRQRLEQAKDNLQIVTALSNLSITQTTANDVREVKALLSPSHPPIDEVHYAAAIRATFGRLLGFADVVHSEQGSPLRALGLQDVWVEQDVVQSQGFGADQLELLDEHVAFLRTSGQLDEEVKERVEAYERLRDVKPSPVLSVLGAASRRRLVVLGHPGMGKSSALREYALQWANAPAVEQKQLPFPILAELKQYKAAKMSMRPGLTLLQYLCDGGSMCCSMAEAPLSALLLSSRPVLLMLDGLDELFSEREVIVADVKTFLNAFDVPSLRVVITSRIIGYKRGDFEGYAFEQFTLQGLRTEQVGQFVDKWHFATYTAAEKATSDARKERLLHAIVHVPSISVLAKNPLLLTMIAIVNRGPELPTRRVRLYDKCVELLLSQWQVELAKEAYTSTRDVLAFGFPEKHRLLRELAWKMQQEERPLGLIVQQDVLEQVVSAQVERVHGLRDVSIVTARAIIDQLRSRHYIISFLGGQSFAFVHRTFLEYFCASHYQDLWMRRTMSQQQMLVELFRRRWQDSSWWEVLRLLSGMVPSEHIAPCLDALLTELVPDVQLLTAGWRQQHKAASVEEIDSVVTPYSAQLSRVSFLVGECVEQLQDRSEATGAIARLRCLLINVACEFSHAVESLVRLWPDDTGENMRAALVKAVERHPTGVADQLALEHCASAGQMTPLVSSSFATPSGQTARIAPHSFAARRWRDSGRITKTLDQRWSEWRCLMTIRARWHCISWSGGGLMSAHAEW